MRRVVFAIVAAALLMFARRRHYTETRCRSCGHILRGISEPRRTECGERV